MIPYVLRAPVRQTVPVVFASAHSGRDYPAAFVAETRLPFARLRRSEDCYVEEIFATAPDHGAPLLQATLPRAWCDLNREAWELDQEMFTERLPPWVNAASPRVQAGLGTIARVVGSGETIYPGKLAWSEAEQRVRECWMPWHAALAGLIDQTAAGFGSCLLIDCHSMPSSVRCRSGAMLEADIVLGDADGTSCTAATTRRVEALLRSLGYRVGRNDPYAGGHITRHYGGRRAGVQALQIEIARRLYMDEERLEKHAGFDPLCRNISRFIGEFVAEAAALT